MKAQVTTSCGVCPHSRGKSSNLCRCTLLDVDVVTYTIEKACPLVTAKIVEVEE